MAERPDEFRLIAELFAPLSQGYPGALGLTDDVAILADEPGMETVVTVDAMVSGVHFLPGDPPDLIARKLVRTNLSDVAAKGAKPFAALLAAAFPKDMDMAWLKRFAAGLAEDVKEFGFAVIGGDTVATPGPLTLSLTAFGRLPAGKALLRSAAKPGQTIWVTGTIGDGALGLKAAQGTLARVDTDHVAFLADRYRLPRPRVSVGPRLIGLASAGMDVSDGLLQDLGHICRASSVGAIIEVDRVPLSAAARAVFGAQGINAPFEATGAVEQVLASVLAGGDDYELLFTAEPEAADSLAEIARSTAVPITAIGRIVAGGGVKVLDHKGWELTLAQGGWRHFEGDR